MEFHMVLLTAGQTSAEYVLKVVPTFGSALSAQDVGNKMDEKVGEWHWHNNGQGICLWLCRPQQSFDDTRVLAMQAYAPGFYISQTKQECAFILENFQAMKISSFELYQKEIQWPHECLPSSFKHLFMWLHPGKVPKVVGVKQIDGALKCVLMSVQWGRADPCCKKMSEPCGDFRIVHFDQWTQGLMFRLHHDGDERRAQVTYFAPVNEVPGNKIYRACADESGELIDISTDSGSRQIKWWHIVLVDLST